MLDPGSDRRKLRQKVERHCHHDNGCTMYKHKTRFFNFSSVIKLCKNNLLLIQRSVKLKASTYSPPKKTKQNKPKKPTKMSSSRDLIVDKRLKRDVPWRKLCTINDR